MRFNRLDLNLLVYLDALIVEKSVTRAAERVFLGQSAMSSALGRLREHFQDQLLVQVGRSMVLTPLAEGLAKPVRNILLQAHAVSAARPGFEPASSEQQLNMVLSDYVASVFLPALVHRIAAEAPKMRFDFRTLGLRYQDEFEAGEVDMLLVPRILLASGHPSEDLFEDSFSCVVWSGNKRIGSTLSEPAYLAAGHVGIEWGAGRMRSIDEDALRLADRLRRIEIIVPFFSLAAPLVVGTQRIATVQTRLAHLMARSWPIRVLPCPIELPHIVESIQWHKYADLDPAVAWFRGVLRSVAGEMPAPPRAARTRRGR